MTQKAIDFIKPKGSKLVLAGNDEYYKKIKEIREQDRRFSELNTRIELLENEVTKLKNLLRERLNG